MPTQLGRRDFLTGLGAAALTAGCRCRVAHGPIVLRLSHSMTAGMTALHVFVGDKFREPAEAATGGDVKVRAFPSDTLGQEREVVQQLQEGLVDCIRFESIVGYTFSCVVGVMCSTSSAFAHFH